LKKAEQKVEDSEYFFFYFDGKKLLRGKEIID
jgi:hypothetical protein